MADHEPDRDQPEHEPFDAGDEGSHQCLVGDERQSLDRVARGWLNRDSEEPRHEGEDEEPQGGPKRELTFVVPGQRHGECDRADDPVDVARLRAREPRDQHADRGQNQGPLRHLDRSVHVIARPDVSLARDRQDDVRRRQPDEPGRKDGRTVRSRERRIKERVQDGREHEV